MTVEQINAFCDENHTMIFRVSHYRRETAIWAYRGCLKAIENMLSDLLGAPKVQKAESPTWEKASIQYALIWPIDGGCKLVLKDWRGFR